MSAAEIRSKNISTLICYNQFLLKVNYCGVGSDEAFGRNIVEDHLSVCLIAGVSSER